MADAPFAVGIRSSQVFIPRQRNQGILYQPGRAKIAEGIPPHLPVPVGFPQAVRIVVAFGLKPLGLPDPFFHVRVYHKIPLRGNPWLFHPCPIHPVGIHIPRQHMIACLLHERRCLLKGLPCLHMLLNHRRLITAQHTFGNIPSVNHNTGRSLPGYPPQPPVAICCQIPGIDKGITQILLLYAQLVKSHGYILCLSIFADVVGFRQKNIHIVVGVEIVHLQRLVQRMLINMIGIGNYNPAHLDIAYHLRFRIVGRIMLRQKLPEAVVPAINIQYPTRHKVFIYVKTTSAYKQQYHCHQCIFFMLCHHIHPCILLPSMHIEPGEPVNLFYLIVVFYHKQEENACFFYKLKYLSKFQFILSLLFLFPNRFLM